jgi:hypothetical protein
MGQDPFDHRLLEDGRDDLQLAATAVRAVRMSMSKDSFAESNPMISTSGVGRLPAHANDR